ncbi:BppU family phage baseplate upper protein [Clostridium novyi]|uniref:BppU family phage baseplate upper protein n=1 Tax=Clostridium novyi TaxID=1542 RepID=UPI00069EC173|nr:BppU family phage baseplate upper protein [Clostridium novyi]
MEKVFNLNIDTKDKKIIDIKGLKQFDNSSVLYINITQNSVSFDLTDCMARLNFLKEDGEILLYMADIIDAKNGKVKIKLSTQVLKNPGIVKVDLSIFDKNIMKITSLDFTMQIEKSIYSNEYYLQRADFDIVQSMHIEEEGRIKNEKTRIEAESNRITDEKKRSDAEELRNEKETERISNEEKRVQAENKRNEDEHTRSEAENKRKECESNRIDQEKIRIENEKTRVEAEDQRKIADNTMAENELARITYEQQRQANEKARTEKETKRITDEKLRTEAEEKRVQNEKLRVEKEAERINSENTRVTAEQKRETNETNRVEAEKTRVKEWDKIKNTFKDNAPGDMKSIVYDKNGNGKVDIAELAESVEWENIKNKPNFDEIGKVKSVNSKTGEVVLKAEDIIAKDGTTLEKFKEEVTTQYEESMKQFEDIRDKNKPQNIAIHINVETGNDDNSGLKEIEAIKTIKRLYQVIALYTHLEEITLHIYGNDPDFYLILKDLKHTVVEFHNNKIGKIKLTDCIDIKIKGNAEVSHINCYRSYLMIKDMKIYDNGNGALYSGTGYGTSSAISVFDSIIYLRDITLTGKCDTIIDAFESTVFLLENITGNDVKYWFTNNHSDNNHFKSLYYTKTVVLKIKYTISKFKTLKDGGEYTE